jgi:hypothetical protein
MRRKVAIGPGRWRPGLPTQPKFVPSLCNRNSVLGSYRWGTPKAAGRARQ